jgi:hypothetical protein
MLVTVLNLAFAGSAVVGGVLLETTGVGSIPWATLGLVLLAWLVVKVGVQAGKAGDITPPLNPNFVILSSSIKLYGALSEYLRPVQMLGYYPDEVLKR